MQTFTAPIRQTKTRQMENIPVTTYRGFSTVGGETTLAQDMADIKNGTHAKSIIKIAALVAQGKTEEANNVKKQLPFRTVTANYRERRLAYGIVRYNPVITLDIDDLDESRLSPMRSAINDAPDTLGSFLSPKRHGYKLFVFRQTEYAHRLRQELLQGEIGYERLEEIHLKLYNDAKQHYEALLGTEIDGSGKDISRGYFMSFDPGLSEHRIAAADKAVGSPYHRPRKGCEEETGKPPRRQRHAGRHGSGSRCRSLSPARRRTLGEAALLQSGDRRKAQHEVPGGQPQQLPLCAGQ